LLGFCPGFIGAVDFISVYVLLVISTVTQYLGMAVSPLVYTALDLPRLRAPA
jgi:hypothetical protein